VSLLSRNIKPLWNSFDLLTDRLMPSLTDRLLIMYGILLQHLFLCYSSCVQSIMGFFYMADVNVFLLVNYIMNIVPHKYFKTVFEWLSLTRQYAQLLLEQCDF